ncbi:hypothetical protein TSAR_008078, partial [Trichomalopsis sarcophagae]
MRLTIIARISSLALYLEIRKKGSKFVFHLRKVALDCWLRFEKCRATDATPHAAYNKLMLDYLKLGHVELVTDAHKSLMLMKKDIRLRLVKKYQTLNEL